MGRWGDAIIVLTVALLAVNAYAADCFCSDCDDCENQLNNNSCSVVYLTADVIDHTWTCIDDPENFSNKVFDCQGHTLDGIKAATSHAVDAEDKVNITVRNCTLADWNRGVHLKYSNHSTIEYNVFIDNTQDGVYVGYGSYNNTVSDNTVTGGGYGIRLDCPTPYLCSGNYILDNNVSINENWGVYLNYADSTIISNNTVENNSRGIVIGDYSDNNTLAGNRVNNNERHGIELDADAANNTLESNTVCYNNRTETAGDWYDVYDNDPNIDDNNRGNNNTCDTTYHYNDTGAVGCTLSCTPEESTTCYCSTCDECEDRLNNNSCTVVYLTADITNQSATCINNPANINGTVFDCAGHTIGGTGMNAGFTTTSKFNLTVRNCIIRNFATGIYNYYGDYCLYINNTFYNMSSTCMYLSGNSGDRAVEYNLIAGNTINDSYRGIRLIDDCRDNIIEDNIITYNTQQGIQLMASGATPTDNNISNNLVCYNSIDIEDDDSNLGFNNTCNNTTTFNDTGIEGCTHSCSVTESFPLIEFVHPTPENGTNTTESGIEVAVNVSETDLEEFVFNWNGTDYTLDENELILFYTDNSTNDTITANISNNLMSLQPQDSLVLAMNFDNESQFGEDYGTLVKDLSRYGNNGTVNGNPTYNSSGGKYGGAFEFGGGDQLFVSDDDSLDMLSNNLTVEAWVRLAGSGGTWGTIVAKGLGGSDVQGDYALGMISSSGRVRFYVYTAGYQFLEGNTSISDGLWHHVVGVLNGPASHLYVDGVLDNSMGVSGSMAANAHNLYIGQYSGSYGFTGSIDEVRIYSRGLCADDVRQHYFSNLGKYDSTRWGFYFNVTDLAVGTYSYSAWANDSSGNENSTETRVVTVSEATNLTNQNLLLYTGWNLISLPLDMG